jgi:undecaprenyl-diphosphatase
MSYILRWDEWLFQIGNSQWIHPFLDLSMPRLTMFYHALYPFIIFVCLVWIIEKKQRGLTTAALMFFALGLSALTTISWLKPLFARPRPLISLDSVRLLIEQPESFSFPSTHAAISFSVALIVACRHTRWAVPVFVWAILMAYTRLYVGVHFPSDLLVGAIWGMMIGVLLLVVEAQARDRLT